MVYLTRLNHAQLVLNPDLIEYIEATPDTVITMTTGHVIRVREGVDQIVEKIVAYRRLLLRSLYSGEGDWVKESGRRAGAGESCGS